MFRIDDLLSSPWTVGILRLATMVALVGFRRWRHLLVFLASILVVEALAYELAIFVASPRPDGVRIIGSWDGPSFPSPPVASLAVTLVGIVYTLVPPGRARSIAKWVAGGTLFVFAFARLYLAVDHPTDILSGSCWASRSRSSRSASFTPNEVFPVTYRRGKRRPPRRRRAPGATRSGRPSRTSSGSRSSRSSRSGWRRPAGSTPLRLRVAAASPDSYVFAKLYAKSHVRADRWYKLGRTILYGALEDETLVPDRPPVRRVRGLHAAPAAATSASHARAVRDRRDHPGARVPDRHGVLRRRRRDQRRRGRRRGHRRGPAARPASSGTPGSPTGTSSRPT